jgi:dienelactone hydrolase
MIEKTNLRCRILCILLWPVLAVVAEAQPYPIGTQTITYQDPARSNRNIQTYLYYPATSAGANAPVANGSFPVVVIGHGFTMNYAPYTYLADTLVPKGYIVAIPNTETGFSPNHTAFGLDLAFVVSKLYSENTNSGSPFYQHVEAQSCVAGHSMGGGCTMLAAASNANVSCTVTLALAETTPSAIAAASNVSAPSLVLSASDDCVTPAATNQTPAYNNLATCKAFVSITNGGHCNFGTSNFNCNFGEMTCNPGGPSLPAATQRALTCRFLVPWVDRFVKGNLSAGSSFATRFNTSVNAGTITGEIQCAILPLELLGFAAKCRPNGGTELQWTTAAEVNVSRMVVQYSPDGIAFYDIGSVPAAGGSDGSNEYNFTDPKIISGAGYYRLRIEDYDEKIQYSPIRSVNCNIPKGIRTMPNPATQGTLRAEWDDAFPTQIEVLDLLGRRVLFQDITPGETSASLNLRYLANGAYLLRIGRQQTMFLVAAEN